MFAIAKNYAAHIAHAQSVYKQTSGRDIVAHAESFAGNFYLIADVGNDDVVCRRSHFDGKLGVFLKMTTLAVYGNKIFGLYKSVNKF